jgi:hypothetical protein
LELCAQESCPGSAGKRHGLFNEADCGDGRLCETSTRMLKLPAKRVASLDRKHMKLNRLVKIGWLWFAERLALAFS